MITDTADRIIAYIRTNRQARPHDLARILSFSPTAIHKQLRRLVMKGKLRKTGKPPKVFYILDSFSGKDSAYINKLPEIVEALKKGYKPEKIILFGSMLEAGKQSHDIDLFLIKNTSVERLGKRATEAWNSLPAKDIPVDFLIYTPLEVKDEIKRGNVFISEILQKGKVLYG